MNVVSVLKDSLRPSNGEERVWVVKWVMDVGEVWAFKTYRVVGYWGAVSIYDVDGNPNNRFVKIVFRSEDEAKAREVANKLLSILRRRTIGSIDPKKILTVLAPLYSEDYDEPLVVIVVEDVMDVHYNGEITLRSYKALLR